MAGFRRESWEAMCKIGPCKTDPDGFSTWQVVQEIHNSALSGSHDFDVSRSEIKCNSCLILRANGLKKRVGKRMLAQTRLRRNLWVLPCPVLGQQDFVGTTWDLGFASSWRWVCE